MKLHFMHAFTIGSSFFFIYAAMVGTSNILLVALTEAGSPTPSFSFFVTACHYLTFSLGSFLANPLIKRYGPIRILRLGIILFTLQICSGMYPGLCQGSQGKGICYYYAIHTMLAICALIGGFGGACIWVAEGVFIKLISHKRSLYTYQSIFSFMFCLSASGGNILNLLFFLSSCRLIYTYLAFGVFAIFSSVLIFMIPKSEKVDQFKRTTEGNPFFEGIKGFVNSIKLTFSKNVWLFQLYSIYHGFEVAYYMGIMSTIIAQTTSDPHGKFVL